VYVLVALIVWPGERRGGLLGVRGARIAWAALWLVMAYLWLLEADSSANATRDAINAAPSGMGWLSSVHGWVAAGARGNGLLIALLLALVTAVIGVAVAANWRTRGLLWAAIVLNLAYWVLGQGFGGIFAGNATDPNAGVPFVLLAVAMYGLLVRQRRPSGVRHAPVRRPAPSRRPAGGRL